MADSLLHLVWGPVNRRRPTSHSTDESSESWEAVAAHLPELSSSCGSERLGMQEIWAHRGTSSALTKAVEQDGGPTPAEGSPELHRAIRNEPQNRPKVQCHQLWSSSASDSDLQAAAHSLEQGNDPLPADDMAASSMGPLSGEAALLDSVSMWSRGTMLHQRGDCRPCHYAHTSTGCIKGRDCSFCHLPHTGNSQHRPCKTRRRQCHRLARLLDEQQPGELHRLVAQEAAGEAGPGTEDPTPQGLALCVQQVASSSPYMRNFMLRHWSAGAPAGAGEPEGSGATSGVKARSNEHAKGRRNFVQL